MKTTIKNFGKLGLVALLFIITTAFVNSTYDAKESDKNSVVVEGKAYWFVTSIKNKKMYVTYIFNNNCNHCRNEIMVAFEKYLVMNDHETDASTVRMSTYHDVKREKLNERRDEEIYFRKRQGFLVVNLDFSYEKE